MKLFSWLQTSEIKPGSNIRASLISDDWNQQEAIIIITWQQQSLLLEGWLGTIVIPPM